MIHEYVMSPKRRYQKSSIQIGLPPPAQPPSPSEQHLLSSLQYRPLTPAEIKVNPCLTSKRIPPQTPSSGKTTTANANKKAGSKDRPRGAGTGGASKGNRTYRVTHHHQHHYELPDAAPTPPSKGPESRPSSSLSHGIFGAQMLQDYLMEETLDSQTPPPQHAPPTPKPRMKSTLPSFKGFLEGGTGEEMEGVLQVRPASRSSRTRPELSSSGAPRRSGVGCRRRVQSTAGGGRPGSGVLPSEEEGGLDPTPDMVDNILGKLRSHDQDWEEIVVAFRQIQRWTQDNPQVIRGILKKVIWCGLPHLGSSRTQLCRIACQCFKTLYDTQRRAMEGEGDKVFQRLLDLCGGPHNKFIVEECKNALGAAVQNVDAVKALNMLDAWGGRHRNQNCREVAASLLVRVMDRLGTEKLLGREHAHKVLPMIVGFLREGLLSTRNSGKQCLAKVYFHPEFQRKLHKHCSPESIRNIQDVLKRFETQSRRGTPSWN